MRLYLRYQCDFGHEWTIVGSELDLQDRVRHMCEYGHPVITISKEPAVDEVEITIRPAARIVDEIKRQVLLQGRYWLVLSSQVSDEQLVSSQSYVWKETLVLAERYRGKTFAEAKLEWERRAP